MKLSRIIFIRVLAQLIRCAIYARKNWAELAQIKPLGRVKIAFIFNDTDHVNFVLSKIESIKLIWGHGKPHLLIFIIIAWVEERSDRITVDPNISNLAFYFVSNSLIPILILVICFVWYPNLESKISWICIITRVLNC